MVFFFFSQNQSIVFNCSSPIYLHPSSFLLFPLLLPPPSPQISGLSLFLLLAVHTTSSIFSMFPRIFIFLFYQLMSPESSAFQILCLHSPSNVPLFLFALSSAPYIHFYQNSYIFLPISSSFFNSYFPQCFIPLHNFNTNTISIYSWIGRHIRVFQIFIILEELGTLFLIILTFVQGEPQPADNTKCLQRAKSNKHTLYAANRFLCQKINPSHITHGLLL